VELKQVLRALVHERADLFRGILLVIVFRPIAYLLPRRLVWGVSVFVAAIMVVVQGAGRRMARDLATAFGVSTGKGLRMAIHSHAKRFNEFALQQKMISGWYRPHSLPVRCEASEEAQRIIASPGSFLLAQSHFERASAGAAVFFPETFDGRDIAAVAVKLPRWIPLPHLWRASLQLRQVLRACRAVRPEGFEIVYLGGAVKKLMGRLHTERLVVSINIDAHWARDRSSSLERPFCGWLRRTFSTGAAKLARVGEVPLLMALPVMGSDNRCVRMRIFGPFKSQAATAEQQDLEVTNAMLDVVEHEVGQRPCDYVLEIGAERRWDAESQSWSAFPAPVLATQRIPGAIT
jgi:lauroyl/myristoyl acyltransferase